MNVPHTLITRSLGRRDYLSVWRAMQEFTLRRDQQMPDEVWLTEHPPVFTQGLNGKPEHLLAPGDIPVIKVDRGGQITYHGPGQLLLYPLLDLRRRGWGVRQVVSALERAVIALLGDYGIQAVALADAPGVYVSGAKIAALGLRIRKGCCYHGLSLNIAMDLEPFRRINPCGHPDLPVTQLRDLGVHDDLEEVGGKLVAKLAAELDYNIVIASGHQELPALLGNDHE